MSCNVITSGMVPTCVTYMTCDKPRVMSLTCNYPDADTKKNEKYNKKTKMKTNKTNKHKQEHKKK